MDKSVPKAGLTRRQLIQLSGATALGADDFPVNISPAALLAASLNTSRLEKFGISAPHIVVEEGIVNASRCLMLNSVPRAKVIIYSKELYRCNPLQIHCKACTLFWVRSFQ